MRLEKKILLIFIISTCIFAPKIIISNNTATTLSSKNYLNKNIPFNSENYINFSKDLHALYEKENTMISEVISNYSNKYKNSSIYYEDLTKNNIIEYNSNKHFTAASTIKVALVMNVADYLHKGKLNLNDMITYNSSHYESGTGILQKNAISGVTKVSIEELMKLAITHSDNIATNMLKQTCEPLHDYVYKITGIKRIPYKNTLTTKQQGLILNRLYHNNDSNPYYEDIINNMKNTIFHDRLDKYLPYDKVAHKIGTYSGFTHDTGIIYTDRPYSLSVFSESIGTEFMAKLSKEIYDIKLSIDEEIYALKSTYFKNEQAISL